MNDITVSVGGETCRDARWRAAELDTSVIALVKRRLAERGSSESGFQHVQRLEREMRARMIGFSQDHVCQWLAARAGAPVRLGARRDPGRR